MKVLKKKLCVLIFCLALMMSVPLFLISCSHNLGYSVVLWSVPEKNLYDGDLVKVYIKSNINKVYVVSSLDSSEKFEIPLWQLSNPASKSKVLAKYKSFSAYKHMYASVAVDGLPVRFEPVNTARQVYRLRQSETIKILQKGEGVPVMVGNKPLEGDWLKIMTNDGTTGWCFSYNLRLYDETKGFVQEADGPQLDDEVERLLKERWYPESYAAMVKNKQVDLDLMKEEYFFDPGLVSGQITLNLKDTSYSFPYKGLVHKDNKVYSFIDAPLNLTIRNETFIAVQYTDEKGMPTSYTFVTLDRELKAIIAEERDRRDAVYQHIVDAGPLFTSSNYGVLQFMSDGTFLWNGYELVPQSILASDSGAKGKVAVKYFLDKTLAAGWDGVLTLHFDNTKKETNFLYRLEDAGLRLEDTVGAQFKGSVLAQRSSNALTLFFGK